MDGYLLTFKNRADSYLKGGNAVGYEFTKEVAGDGMVIVKVIQNVAQ